MANPQRPPPRPARQAAPQNGPAVRHHDSLSFALVAALFLPWALLVALWTWGLMHPRQVDRLPAACAQARTVPEEYLCTDMQACSQSEVILSSGIMTVNRQTRISCPDAKPLMLMEIPDTVTHPDAETQAKVMAAFALLTKEQQQKVMVEAWNERERFKANGTEMGGAE